MIDSLLLATGNAGKIREMQKLLADVGIGVRSQAEFAIEPVAETGLGFIENALLKARHAAGVSGLPALADDSGLCVDALCGAPGIHSARFAGAGASDEDNNQRLLGELAALPAGQRGARYHCVLVLVRDRTDPVPLICEASWAGRIAEAPRGNRGFGYDPLFLPDGMDCTAAELDPSEKNRISHRGQAMQILLRRLRAT